MAVRSQKQPKWIIAFIALIVAVGLDTFMTIMDMSAHRPVEFSLFVLFIFLLMTVYPLLSVRDLYWRYGFVSAIVSALVGFLSKVLYQTSHTAGLMLALISLAPLVLSISFLLKFKRMTNSQPEQGYKGVALFVMKTIGGLALALAVFYIFYRLRGG